MDSVGAYSVVYFVLLVIFGAYFVVRAFEMDMNANAGVEEAGQGATPCPVLRL
jgi:hypothetical protein